MNIVERVKDIIMKPKDTWPVIKGESVEIKQLIINYAAPLALIPAVSGLIGMTLVGIRLPAGNLVRAPFITSLLGGIVGYVLGLAGILLGAWVIKFLAPYFSSKADLTLAAKLVVYSATPFWLVGIFSAVPGLGVLSIIGLYGVYLLVLGLPVLLETPPNKVVLYTISILVVGFVVSMVLNLVVAGLFFGPMYMKMMAV